jgi:hypothetical protein
LFPGNNAESLLGSKDALSAKGNFKIKYLIGIVGPKRRQIRLKRQRGHLSVFQG